MDLALRQAEAALEMNEIPVGVVVVKDDVVLGAAHNSSTEFKEVGGHAELIAMRKAIQSQGKGDLRGATVYATLEPCVMCAGALVVGKVSRVVFGAFDTRFGAGGSVYNIFQDPRLNHQVEVLGGLKGKNCGDLMKEFFLRRRGSLSN